MPFAAAGETLPERAQRILGLDLDSWLAAESTSDSNSQPSKRSDQIAHAQRKHRQRTQSYIQALEQEVLRLRNHEKSLSDELETLRAQIKSKSAAVETCAIPTPPAGLDSNLKSIPESDTFMVDWASVFDVPPERTCCITAAEKTPPQLEFSTVTSIGRLSKEEGSYKSPESWIENEDEKLDQPYISNTSNLLDPSIGVDLILKLERPCISHLKHAVTSDPRNEGLAVAPYNWGTNHCYNLSTRLYHEYRTSSSTDSTIQISYQDLDNLLEASERLQLSDELTPIQVWAIVCQLHSVNRLDLSIITAMFDELAKYSYCNSFGSAISKRIVRAALQHFLGRTSI